jgi:hypothetical protein
MFPGEIFGKILKLSEQIWKPDGNFWKIFASVRNFLQPVWSGARRRRLLPEHPSAQVLQCDGVA